MGERVDPHPAHSALVAEVISVRPLVRKGLAATRLRILEGELAPRIEARTSDGRRVRIVRESFVPVAEREHGGGAWLRLLGDGWDQVSLLVGDRLVADTGR